MIIQEDQDQIIPRLMSTGLSVDCFVMALSEESLLQPQQQFSTSALLVTMKDANNEM